MKYVLIILLAVFSMNCSGDDGGSNNTQNPNSIYAGTWNMTHASGGFSGIDEDIANGKCNMVLNVTTEQATVINNFTIEDNITFLFSNTYDLSFNAENQTISFGNVSYSIVSITDTTLIISDGAIADGYTYTFIKQ